MAKRTHPHPMQPVVIDEQGTARFKLNLLVSYLLDFATPRGCGMNELAMLPNIPKEDREQLAQLIGYSISGFGELPYVRDETYEEAELRERLERSLHRKPRKRKRVVK